MKFRIPRIRIDLGRGPEVRILLNTNVKMTRHKAAAQAVHAALNAFDVKHGRVIVLGARPDQVAEMDHVIRDAGLTEVEPGTMTAGASVTSPRRSPGTSR